MTAARTVGNIGSGFTRKSSSRDGAMRLIESNLLVVISHEAYVKKVRLRFMIIRLLVIAMLILIRFLCINQWQPLQEAHPDCF